VLNGTFYVRKYVVGRKEKIMVASYGENSGFTAVGADELALVNGGKSSGGGSHSVTVGENGISFPFGNGAISVNGNIGDLLVSVIYSISK
jgi:hypothetical protein